jgi:serine/threonine-protein kinase
MAVRKVGSSRILREIGRGAMGVVYEAYQEGLDRRVAVKALEAGRSRTRAGELAERFRREGRAYAQIRHQAIVAVHDLVEKDRTLYLVTEFVDGTDLGHVLAAGGALPADCVATIGARLADALDAVHVRALLHRDVKPTNVMISRRGDVKLMDFGIMKDPTATELTSIGEVMGTPAYVAPEVLEGDPASEHSDVWSLGVTLYEMATGSRPFTGKDFHELFGAVRKGDLVPVRDLAPGFPRRVAKAIERCLEKRPGRRWETAGALARELEACAARLLGEARPQERLAALMAERGLGVEAGSGPEAPVEGGADERSATGSARRFASRVAWAIVAAAALVAGIHAWVGGSWPLR